MKMTCPGCGLALKNQGAYANHAKRSPCKGGTIEQRFWAAVKKGDGCWEYQRSVKPEGYCFVRFRYKQWYAHRFSWFLHFGEIPAGKDVCHHCDNRRCVRPDHLFVGTEKDNMQDMLRKGRNPILTLTPDQVREIREALKAPAYRGQQRELAKKYGVLPGVISDIKQGWTYQWVT